MIQPGAFVHYRPSAAASARDGVKFFPAIVIEVAGPSVVSLLAMPDGFPAYQVADVRRDQALATANTWRAVGTANAFADPFLTAISARSSIRIAGGIDSLTYGGGSPTTLYATTLVPALKALYGDGGVGTIPFDNAGFGAVGMSSAFFKNGSVGYITDLAYTDTIRKIAPGGKGLYVTAGDGSTPAISFADWDGVFFPGYDTITVFGELRSSGASYLLKQPGAGNNGPQITISEANGYPLNTPIATSFKRDPNYAFGCDVANITGNISIYTFEATKSTAAGGGLIFSNWGIGGQKTLDWAKLDDARQRFWWSQFAYDAFIMNGGMNDRLTSHEYDFANAMMTCVSRVQACAKTRVLLVIPHEPSDIAAGGVLMQNYPFVLDAIAKQRGCGLIDDRIAMGGTYAQSVAAGFMDADGVHPSATGNAVRASAYLANLALA